MNDIESLRQEAESLKNQIRVCTNSYHFQSFYLNDYYFLF
jgi:hypothetical protein